MYQEKGLYIKFAKAVKEAVDVPVICAGRMDDPFMAAKAVSDGACDIISLGRPLLADPDYVNKLKADKLESIRPCLSCQEGCMGRIHAYGMLNCAVNPAAGRERAERLVPRPAGKENSCDRRRTGRLRGRQGFEAARSQRDPSAKRSRIWAGTSTRQASPISRKTTEL